MDRLLTGLPRGNRQIYLSWRLFKEDAPDEPFDVERRRPGDAWQRVSAAPVVDSTNYLDTAPEATAYEYRVVARSQASNPVRVDAGAEQTNLAVEFPLLHQPTGEDADPSGSGVKRSGDGLRFAIGDLENDGRYGVVVLESGDNRLHVCAYALDGRSLWDIDTGLPFRGKWNNGDSYHVPCAAWDVNGDGRTEVVFHRGPGAAFPDDFYAEAGPDETLIAVDGETGETIWEVPWPAKEARVMFTTGYLNGPDHAPSVVVLDGTYGNETVTAVDGRTGEVQWRVDQARAAGHNLDIDDIDGDGCMEVIVGGICYRGDGTVLWEAESFGHTDVSKPARFLPNLPGLQILYLSEKENPGVFLVDSGGQTLWHVPFGHAHWCWIGRYEVGGDQLMIHAAEKGKLEYFPVFFPDGTEWLELTRHQAHRFAAVGWEADGVINFAHRKEKCIKRIDAGGRETRIPDSELPEGTRFGRIQICADLIGDFRENFACVDYERGTFFVAQNPQPSGKRALSPVEDFAYRHERNQLGSGYYTYVAPPKLDV